MLSGGNTSGKAFRKSGISAWSIYRWHKKAGGMQVPQTKNLMDVKTVEPV
jgi:hypothetical protein